MTNDELQVAYQQLLARRRAATRVGCAHLEDVQRVATARLQHERDAGVFDHVMACAACRSEYELLRATSQAARAVAPSALRRVWMPLAAAATALLAVTLYFRAPAAGTSGVRADDTTAVRVVAPSSVATGTAITVAWHPVAGADAYRVELLDTLGTALHSSVTSDSSLTVPAAVLPLGTEAVDWLVVARRADGNETRSPLVRVRVVP
ncbi:MAG: hypothetical protein IPK85_23935 [Gemmatimonadetes bacterium]|nr:hypothetical protein [Gemmatimonadota bacterium]